MKCPLRGTDCRDDCALWVYDEVCAIALQARQTHKLNVALEALVKVMQARCD